MALRFKVGDRVRVLAEVDNLKGEVGVIFALASAPIPYHVKFGDGNWCPFNEMEIELDCSDLHQSIADEYDYITRLGERG